MICKHLDGSWDLNGALGQGNTWVTGTLYLSYNRRSLVLSYKLLFLLLLWVSLDHHGRKVNGSDCVSGDSPIRFI